MWSCSRQTGWESRDDLKPRVQAAAQGGLRVLEEALAHLRSTSGFAGHLQLVFAPLWASATRTLPPPPRELIKNRDSRPPRGTCGFCTSTKKQPQLASPRVCFDQREWTLSKNVIQD